jgi:hypothetical protein
VTIWDGFLLGVVGGVFGELVNLFKLRQQPVNLLPVWIRSLWYWTVTVMMILSDGGLVAIYLGSRIPVAPILAVNIGASAPLILGALVAQVPAIPPGNVN